MNTSISSLQKAKKSTAQSLDQLLEQIARLKSEIERVQSGYKLYRNMRNQSLGKLLREYRSILIDQIKTLDLLHQSPIANKTIQQSISNEIKTIVHSFEEHFTWSNSEIDFWDTTLFYHTGNRLKLDELPIELNEKQDEKNDITPSVKKSIKEIYKSLMKFYHPDLNNATDVLEKAQQITRYYEDGELDNLLLLYQQTFQKTEQLDHQVHLRIQLEQELELLNLRYTEMLRQLGTDQNITEKSALKRVKREARNMRDFLKFQHFLLQNVFCNLENFKSYLAQK